MNSAARNDRPPGSSRHACDALAFAERLAAICSRAFGESVVAFDFLGYTFRPRLSRNRAGDVFVGFVPAVSDDARTQLGWEIRRWRLHLRSGTTLTDLARSINVIVRGWINYYGRFYRSELVRLLKRINEYLVRWARWKYKRRRSHPRQGAQVPRRGLPTRARPIRPLAVWCAPRWLDDGSRMTGDCHVRFYERRGVRLPRRLTRVCRRAVSRQNSCPDLVRGRRHPSVGESVAFTRERERNLVWPSSGAPV